MANGWHLDKRVPITLIATLVMQSTAILWWAASMNARVDALERQSNAQQETLARLSRLEARQELMLQRMSELSAKLDQQQL